MLRSLKAKNFKRHKNLEINFSEGLNVIRGPNGAGKSSALEAVSVAIYGMKAVPGGSKVAVNREAKDFEIELQLDIPMGLATVKRTSKNASVHVDGVVKATGSTQVTELLTEQLGMDLRQFKMLAYSEQGETAALFTIGAMALQRAVEEMSGADVIDRVIQKAADRIKKLEGEVGAREFTETAPLAGAVEAAKQQVAEAQAHDTQVKVEVEKATAAVTAAEKAVSDAQASNRERHRILSSRQSWEAELANITAEAGKIDNELAEMPTTSTTQTSQNLANAQARHQDLVNLARRRGELDTGIQTLEAWMVTAVAGKAEEERRAPLIEEALVKVNAGQQAVADAKAAAGAARTAYQAAKKAADDARAGAACALCKRPFDTVDPDHVAALEVAAEAAESEVTTADLAVEAAQKGHAEATKAHQALLAGHPGTGWAALIVTEGAKLEALKVERTALPETNQAAIDALAGEVDLARKAHESSVLTEGIRARLIARKAEIQPRRSYLEVEIGKLPAPPVEVEVEPLQAALSQANAARGGCLVAQGASSAAVAAANQAKVSAEAVLAKAVADNEALERTGKRLGQLQSLVKFLRENRARFLEETWAGIMARVSEVMSLATNGRITQLRRDDDTFLYTEEGFENPIEAMSGGQRAIAGVGLRLALETAFFGTGGMVMLDEPSAELNEEYAATLAGVLAAQNRQIVMVTHREAEEYSAGQVIEIGG